MSVQAIYDAVTAYDEDRVAELVTAEIEAGTDVNAILNEGMIAALDEIGRKFSDGVVFVPEMLMAAEAVQAGLEILRPKLVETGAKPVGTVILGTVKGDLHDIGKNLVGMMLEGAGFRLIDLGTDVDPEQFISSAQEHEADIVALSGLLTTSMPEMERAVAAMREANQTRNINVRTMVGGPPINPEFAERIGADAYGRDAPGAVEQARNLMKA
jgi:5-methyltetrahydrofolate--homocysteine methyltransferase